MASKKKVWDQPSPKSENKNIEDKCAKMAWLDPK